MPDPKRLLADDEQVVAHPHPHWISLVPATSWCLTIFPPSASVSLTCPPPVRTPPLLIAILVLGLTLLPLARWRTCRRCQAEVVVGEGGAVAAGAGFHRRQARRCRVPRARPAR
jgi:hypothetical protein